MARTVRGALVQASWTGDKESMIQKHEAARPRGGQAGRPGHPASRSCSTGRTSARSRTPSTTPTPSSSRTARRPSGCRTSPSRPAWSSSPRCTRRTRTPPASTTTPPRSSMPTGRTWASTARPTSRTSRASGRSSTSGPATSGYPVFETAVGKVGVYICYDRHFPEGARALGLNGAEMVLHPERHLARPVRVSLADRAGQPRGRQRLLRRAPSTGSASSRGRRRLLRPELLLRPARPIHRRRRRRARRGADRSATWTSTRSPRSDKTWQFYRDRRPDAYGDLVRP